MALRTFVTMTGAVLALVMTAALPLRGVEAQTLDVQRVVSDQGIEAWLVEDHANPIISMEVAFRGGAALDPEGKAGLANLASGLLDQGAGGMDSQAFQKRLAENAIRMSFSARRDSLGASLQTLRENRDTAADLLSLALTQPTFDEKAVERRKAQVLAGIAAGSERPQTIAGKAFSRLLFPNHPYGTPVVGTRETVPAITPKDLHEFVSTRPARKRMVIGVSGAIEPEELKDFLDRAFADLPESLPEPAAIPDTAPKAAGETVVIERDIPQSWVVFGHEGVRRDHPEYYTAAVVNYILGGGSFASRLYEQVREERGLVYSVYTYLDPREHAALLAGGLGTGNAQVGEAVEVVREQWRRLAEEGPTREEVEDAKTYLIGNFALNLASTSDIASVLRAIQLHDLGIDHLERRDDLIESVTFEDARRFAGKLLDPDALTVVAVGKPEGLEPTRPAPEEGS